MTEIYLDNNATTRPLPEVRDAMLAALGEEFGNPSSSHGAGERARRALHAARTSVARLVGSFDDQVLFTSSGTEANNLVLLSCIDRPGAKLVTTEVEHSSVLKTADHLERTGCTVIRLGVSRSGLVDLDELADSLTPAPDLISIQWVNNETGVLQPIAEIAALCQERDIPFHSDAAQAVGKIAVDVSSTPVTYLTCTAHKIHGPQGVGALVTRRRDRLRTLLHGGPQESGLRAGTENLPGIVGFGVAADLRRQRLDEVNRHLTDLRDGFERSLLERLDGVSVNGDLSSRVSNTSNLLFQDTDGQALVARLDSQGVRCSQSSACTNHRPEPSYVLEAMGLSEDEAYSSVRFSFSELTTPDEVDRAANRIVQEVQHLRALIRRAEAPKQPGFLIGTPLLAGDHR